MNRAGLACLPPCGERVAAMAVAEFVWSALRCGWVFPDTVRHTSDIFRLRYALGELPENHDREPYTWDTCPWCGGDLGQPDYGEGPE